MYKSAWHIHRWRPLHLEIISMQIERKREGWRKKKKQKLRFSLQSRYIPFAASFSFLNSTFCFCFFLLDFSITIKFAPVFYNSLFDCSITIAKQSFYYCSNRPVKLDVCIFSSPKHTATHRMNSLVRSFVIVYSSAKLCFFFFSTNALNYKTKVNILIVARSNFCICLCDTQTHFMHYTIFVPFVFGAIFCCYFLYVYEITAANTKPHLTENIRQI